MFSVVCLDDSAFFSLARLPSNDFLAGSLALCYSFFTAELRWKWFVPFGEFLFSFPPIPILDD